VATGGSKHQTCAVYWYPRSRLGVNRCNTRCLQVVDDWEMAGSAKQRFSRIRHPLKAYCTPDQSARKNAEAMEACFPNYKRKQQGSATLSTN
jgi:hypothetical protein